MTVDQLRRIIREGITLAGAVYREDTPDVYSFMIPEGGYAEIRIIMLVDHLFITYAATRHGEANGYGLRNAERLEADDIHHITRSLIG